MLPNGARLIVSEQHALPLVVVQMLIDAGARRDPGGKEGLAGLTADLLTEGTKTRSASQISEATDFIGASLGSSADTVGAAGSITAVPAIRPSASLKSAARAQWITVRQPP